MSLGWHGNAILARDGFDVEAMDRLDRKRRLCPTFLVFTRSEISRLTEIVREFRDGDYVGGLCCTNPVRDSSCESSVVAVIHDQTQAPDLRDQELASL